jgi:hypothetical protein
MWPWEHAAVGYLVYSLGLRALGREPPGDREAVGLLVATQIPDLVDKPLSWVFGVFPTGYALGHSALVALPVGAAVLAAGRARDRFRLGAAVVAGYWAHLAADALNPIRSGGAPLFGRVLWPAVTGTPYEEDLGAGRGLAYLSEFAGSLVALDPVTLVTVYLLLPLVTLGVWVLDGAPGTGPVRDAVGRWRRDRD